MSDDVLAARQAEYQEARDLAAAATVIGREELALQQSMAALDALARLQRHERDVSERLCNLLSSMYRLGEFDWLIEQAAKLDQGNA